MKITEFTPKTMSKCLHYTYLLILFVSVASHADQDDDKPDDTVHSLTADNPHANWQETAGIKTQILQASSQANEIAAFGTVLSIEPLIMLRQQYLAALAQQESAQARYEETNQNWQRTQNLHQHDIVSTRRLQEQQAQWQTDKAQLNASSLPPQSILASSRLQWGSALTDWFILNRGNQSENFTHNRAQLIEIILPAHLKTPIEMTQIAVNSQALRQPAVTASLISQAPSVDSISQGIRYFFAVQGDRMPIGSHLHAWVVTDEQASSGVLVPESAVIWHLGQALVFIKSETGEFNRQILSDIKRVDQGYRVSTGLQPGDEVVITGAQTLLSRELKALIPDEDDD